MGKPKYENSRGKKSEKGVQVDHVGMTASQQWREQLAAMVPLRQLAFFFNGGLTRTDLIEAHINMEYVGTAFDHALSRAAEEGEVANLINRISTAIAALSYMPGGIEAWNQHFDAMAFLTGLVGGQDAQAHVQSSLQRCFGETPPSQEALALLMRKHVDAMLAKVKRVNRW